MEPSIEQPSKPSKIEEAISFTKQINSCLKHQSCLQTMSITEEIIFCLRTIKVASGPSQVASGPSVLRKKLLFASGPSKLPPDHLKLPPDHQYYGRNYYLPPDHQSCLRTISSCLRTIKLPPDHVRKIIPRRRHGGCIDLHANFYEFRTTFILFIYLAAYR